MANPPGPDERGTPAGLFLRDGFASLITFADNLTIELWEKEATAPGADGGDAIDTSTFHNVLYRTKWNRTLIEITDGAFTCAYDPTVLTTILALINVQKEITVTFNDLSTWAFWGYMKSFVPQNKTDGEQPEAQVEFVITNTDDTFAEEGPVVASVAGT